MKQSNVSPAFKAFWCQIISTWTQVYFELSFDETDQFNGHSQPNEASVRTVYSMI